MNLREFLRLPHRFKWGGTGVPHYADPEGRIYNDCTCFCATWAQVLSGRDPAKDIRGTYRDADGAKAVIEAYGGLVNLASMTLEPIGFVRTGSLQDGDIGVIATPAGIDGELREVGAVRFGPLWATLGPSGIAAKRAETIAAWRFEP